MIQSNRVTVIVDDNAVYLDDGVYLNLNLSQCNIPSDVHALQFKNGQGEIEYRDSRPNLSITELPDWAYSCIELWEQARLNDPDFQ